MDDALGTKIASSAVPGASFTRVPSGVAQGEVSWDEMGQLGLHKALNEYYRLSASQRRLCAMRGGDGGALPCALLLLLVPPLPGWLAPPALLSGARRLLYAAAWLLYFTTPLVLPLALWLLFAADGTPALAPGTAAAAARLHPTAGAAAEARRHALRLLRAEVARLWDAVFDAQLEPEQTASLEGVAAAVAQLCAETGVALPPGAAGSEAALLTAVQQVRADVGLV